MKFVSNGMVLFVFMIIIISLDGFCVDFVDRGLILRFNVFVKEGVLLCYMLLFFFSVIFFNYYILVIGLYFEVYGVVGNFFWDFEFKEEFYYIDFKRSLDLKWWKGELFWVIV